MLKNKTILVTGASSGIGYAVASHLIAEGAQVVALGRDPERLSKLQGAMRHLSLDLTDFAAYRAWVGELPALDGFVHSAGIVENNPVKFFSLEKYQRTIDINQTAPLLLTSELVRARKLNEDAGIVFISSINGNIIGMKGCAAYAASKAALSGIAKVLALELAPKRIRVNCVQPGMVETALIQDRAELTDESTRLDMARYPLGQRYAQPQEVAGAVAFLLSSASSFMTAQSLVVDGGFSVQ